LIDTFVIEPNRHASGRQEYGAAVNARSSRLDDRLRIGARRAIHSKYSVRRSPFDLVEDLIEVVSGHRVSPWWNGCSLSDESSTRNARAGPEAAEPAHPA
jgi:hypothetical protein